MTVTPKNSKNKIYKRKRNPNLVADRNTSSGERELRGAPTPQVGELAASFHWLGIFWGNQWWQSHISSTVHHLIRLIHRDLGKLVSFLCTTKPCPARPYDQEPLLSVGVHVTGLFHFFLLFLLISATIRFNTTIKPTRSSYFVIPYLLSRPLVVSKNCVEDEVRATRRSIGDQIWYINHRNICLVFLQPFLLGF